VDVGLDVGEGVAVGGVVALAVGVAGGRTVAVGVGDMKTVAAAISPAVGSIVRVAWAAGTPLVPSRSGGIVG
jgi:hypothetical protein